MSGAVALAALALSPVAGCAEQPSAAGTGTAGTEITGDPDVMAALRARPSEARLVQSADVQQVGRLLNAALDRSSSEQRMLAGSSALPGADEVVAPIMRTRAMSLMEMAAVAAFAPSRFQDLARSLPPVPADVAAILKKVARGLEPASGDERRGREAQECVGDNPPDLYKCQEEASAERRAVFGMLFAGQALGEAGLTSYRMMRGLGHAYSATDEALNSADEGALKALAQSIVRESRKGMATGGPPDVRDYVSAGGTGPGGLAGPSEALVLLSREEMARLRQWLASPAGIARNGALAEAYARANDAAAEEMLVRFFRTMRDDARRGTPPHTEPKGRAAA